MSRKNKWVWEHFKLNKKSGKIQCNKCDYTFNCLNNYYYHKIKHHLFHIHDIHDEQDISRWKNDTKHEVWQYFSKLNGFEIRCKFKNCKTLFKIPNISNLIRHLKKQHQDIIQYNEEDRIIQQILIDNCLSRHFELKNFYATCRNCKENINIFEGIDTLKCHSNKYHNINEDSECKEKIGDNDADGMAEQSIEENNAGPSSDRNNIPRQSLKNQKSQQR